MAGIGPIVSLRTAEDVVMQARTLKAMEEADIERVTHERLYCPLCRSGDHTDPADLSLLCGCAVRTCACSRRG